MSLTALSVKMSRVQKRLFVLPSKKARPHIVCVGVVRTCTMCSSTWIYFSPVSKLWIALTCSAWPIPPPSGTHEAHSFRQPILKEAAEVSHPFRKTKQQPSLESSASSWNK